MIRLELHSLGTILIDRRFDPASPPDLLRNAYSYLHVVLAAFW